MRRFYVFYLQMVIVIHLKKIGGLLRQPAVTDRPLVGEGPGEGGGGLACPEINRVT